ncbi:unnamed protein product [Miscanthus lutarioriparius]|uniref:Uncharacterized protein n=1 Tax=Miscanthus lutarioriparius TaxID=422564 RepID=A0A811MEC7_9POAL|nr:unnamed protein product [Miscanthus lutarioriparius]
MAGTVQVKARGRGLLHAAAKAAACRGDGGGEVQRSARRRPLTKGLGVDGTTHATSLLVPGVHPCGAVTSYLAGLSRRQLRELLDALDQEDATLIEHAKREFAGLTTGAARHGFGAWRRHWVFFSPDPVRPPFREAHAPPVELATAVQRHHAHHGRPARMWPPSATKLAASSCRVRLTALLAIDVGGGKRMAPVLDHAGGGAQELPTTLSMVDTITTPSVSSFGSPSRTASLCPPISAGPMGVTQLQRMGIGLVVSIFSMVVVGMLDIVQLCDIARHGLYAKDDIVSISIFWQIPTFAHAVGPAALGRRDIVVVWCGVVWHDADLKSLEWVNDLGSRLCSPHRSLATQPPPTPSRWCTWVYLSLYMSDGGGVDMQ